MSIIKNVDEILNSHLNIEIESDVFVNKGILDIFQHIKQELKFLKIGDLRLDQKKKIKAAIYEYDIGNAISVTLYINTKYDYMELVHFYDNEHKIPALTALINLTNRNTRISKIVSTYDDERVVEISARYNGEFVHEYFVKFLQNFHEDIMSYYNLCDKYILQLSQEEMLNKSLKKLVSKSKIKSKK
jgi:hypothetical protein